ncbi:MAG: short-subunit dehydrogenase [Flavobacteriales bacterium]|jgi:short-subunit dehydrogenase
MTTPCDTALITGASSGIGEALAEVFAQHQYNLILVARNQPKLETLRSKLHLEYGVEISVRPCDLSSSSNVKALCDALLRDQTQVDVLVNNAGTVEHGSFVQIQPAEHERIVQLNVCAITSLLAYLLPPMVARGKGRVLNIASLGAFQPLPSVATYAATKAFVLSLSEALAEEVRGTGVTVTAVCPGLTATNMVAGSQKKSPALRRIPPFVFADARTVAHKAFKACHNGDALLVPGLKNNLASMLSRATPKWLVRIITGIVGRATLPRY